MASFKAGPISLNPGTAIGIVPPFVSPLNPHGEEPKSELPKRQWPDNPGDVPLSGWDSGVFITELMKLDLLTPKKLELTEKEHKAVQMNPELLLTKAAAVTPKPISVGTYRGTQLAMTKTYNMVEERYKSYMDVANFEPTVPSKLPLSRKKQYYIFSAPEQDNFPPHLNLAFKFKDPQTGEQSATLGPAEIFDKMRLAQLSNLLPALIPKSIGGRILAGIGQAAAWGLYGSMGSPDKGKTIADVEEYNQKERHSSGRRDIFDRPNIGDLQDWFTDARMAQQNFTGTNPTTIELASDFWINHFIENATDSDEGELKMKDKITRLSQDKEQRARLYMQDYSYFRKAAGLNDTDVIFCVIPEDERDADAPNNERRYGVASVCLFHLDSNDKLHPLAIVIDWRGSAENSVTVYNKELVTEDQQRFDWPWRYAKTCVQTSDWMRHEVTTHLTNTHLIEEATIVAAQRCFEDDHPVLQMLYPHWQKTLSLNAAARVTLVPHVITALIGFDRPQAYKFIQYEYNNFDFKGRYVPLDLERRGFNPAELNDRKYHNYAYARCIYSMWDKIRTYVKEMLRLHYKSDADVASDTAIKDWCETLQRDPSPDGDGGANIKSFPNITTFDGLVDAVTMCIHIASPQHTAVNYLQNFYQAFVINKPACLYKPPPTSKEQLYKYTEQDLVDALPINHNREWLLASHIPYLLSFKPGDKESLISYALSKWHLYLHKTEKDDPHAKEITDAAYNFYQALARSEEEFAGYGHDTWDSDKVHYDVLSPDWNAVSILI